MDFGQLLKSTAKNFAATYLKSLKRKAIIGAGAVILCIVLINGIGGRRRFS